MVKRLRYAIALFALSHAACGEDALDCPKGAYDNGGVCECLEGWTPSENVCVPPKGMVEPDAGMSKPDAGSPRSDGGMLRGDGSVKPDPDRDAQPPGSPRDTGAPSDPGPDRVEDAGDDVAPLPDAGKPPITNPDASKPNPDAGRDAGRDPDAAKPAACTPQEEVCDQKDNDCDMQTDEDGVCSKVVQLGVGSFGCVLRAGGTVSCWGGIFPATPTNVMGVSEAVELAVGKGHACVRQRAGTVRCWGAGKSGQLGDGKQVDSLSAVQVAGLSNIKTLAAGDETSCAVLADGSVSCWGSDMNTFIPYRGQYGETYSPTPKVVAGLSTVDQLTLGITHGCARHADGGVSCWGSAETLSAVRVGSLGREMVDSGFNPPARVPQVSGVKKVAAGGHSTCALLEGGSVTCWGGIGASLGRETIIVDLYYPTNLHLPQPAKDLGGTATEIAAAGGTACVLLTNGAVRCFGSNACGELGNGAVMPPDAPPTTTPNLTAQTAVSVGQCVACALDNKGAVSCWGKGEFGILGPDATGIRGATVIPGIP